jgi:D-alanyl-D-alanine carboxypeptidase
MLEGNRILRKGEKMSRKRISNLFMNFILLAFLLYACTPAAAPSPIATTAPSPTTPPPTPTTAPSPTAPPDWRSKIDSFAKSYVKNHLVGMTLAIRRKGEPDWVQAYGFADLEKSIPASADTVYQLHDISLQFTAAAVMQLVEKGQLDLDAPISRYLKNLPTSFQNFTIHQLLTHTSLINWTYATNKLYESTQNFTSQELLQEVIPTFQIEDVKNSNNPYYGVNFIFSYGNYMLAGLIIEKVSGLSYADYMKKNVFTPAGLQHTSYCLPPPKNMTNEYEESVLFNNNLSLVQAAGALCSTAGDLLIWADALTSGKVIRPESYQKMITPFPARYCSSCPLWDYGYGLVIDTDRFGFNISHGGWEGGILNNLISYPEKGLTIALLTNTYYMTDPWALVKVSIIPLVMP